MRSFNVIITCFLAVACITTQTQAQYQLALQPGTFTVGFKAATYFDLGRHPLAEQTENFQQGRAVHISVWYPASDVKGKSPMPFSQYADFVSQMINPASPTQASRAESFRQIQFFMSQISGDTALLARHKDRLWKSPTRAFLHATPIKETFPVLFYPESPHLNSLLAEYLASHGYIVVAVSRFGSNNAEFEWQNVRGIETLVQDCQFALSVIKQEFNLNHPKVATLGVGMNASAGLAWMMRSPVVQALVSLEGGVLTGYEFELIKKSPFHSVRDANKPMLVLHSPHPAVDPKFIDAYTYADRYVVSFPVMREFYYLNYGVWEATMNGILGPAPGDTKSGFEAVAQMTLQFLNHQLKSNPQATQYLRALPTTENKLFKASFLPGLPIPPTAQQLDELYQKEGFDKLHQAVVRYTKDNPQTYTYEFMNGHGIRLIQEGKFEEVMKWADTFRNNFPDAAIAFVLAARSRLELKKNEEAKLLYQQALMLLESDTYLDTETKSQLRPSIASRIQQLSK